MDATFQAGDVVYFLTPDKRSVDFGICKDFYCDGYGLELYEYPDFRTVCGVPIKNFEFNQARRKLPKGWSWETDLCQIGFDEAEGFKPKYSGIHMDRPEELKQAIENGALVKPSSQDKHCRVEADITKEGYTIVRKYPLDSAPRPDLKCVRSDNCFHTYAEAKAASDAYFAEFKRQSELSDYDWSVEQIDAALTRWKTCSGVLEEDVANARAWLLAQKNVEDLVVRLYGGGIQFKYERNRRWTQLDVS